MRISFSSIASAALVALALSGCAGGALVGAAGLAGKAAFDGARNTRFQADREAAVAAARQRTKQVVGGLCRQVAPTAAEAAKCTNSDAK